MALLVLQLAVVAGLVVHLGWRRWGRAWALRRAARSAARHLARQSAGAAARLGSVPMVTGLHLPARGRVVCPRCETTVLEHAPIPAGDLAAMRLTPERRDCPGCGAAVWSPL